MLGHTSQPRLPHTALAALAAPAALAFVALAFPAALAAQATPTSILIRVTSHDAKIIGSGVGGARVAIRDVESGAILASGIQEGGTGNTKSIMVEPRVRGATVFDTDGAAGFLATLDLERPTMIEIAVEGPLGSPGFTQRATKTMLILPGIDVLGEGVVIELVGLTVVLESPTGEAAIVAGEPLTVTATVTMLCGCPTEPGGLWDADDLEIVALVLREGEVVAEHPLTFAGIRSTYQAELTVAESGSAELVVIATNSRTGNSGMGSRTLDVRPAP
jgi:hypothetical protein